MENEKIVELVFRHEVEEHNWVSYLPNGKVVLVDNTQRHKVKLEPHLHYRCKIVKELDNICFCHVIDSVFLPRLIRTLNGEYRVIYKKDGSVTHQTFKNVVDAIGFCEQFEVTVLIGRRDKN